MAIYIYGYVSHNQMVWGFFRGSTPTSPGTGSGYFPTMWGHQCAAAGTDQHENRSKTPHQMEFLEANCSIVIGIKFYTEKNRIGTRDRDLSIEHTRTCSQTSKPYHFVSSSSAASRCSMLCSVTTVCAVLASRLFWDFQRHLVKK